MKLVYVKILGVVAFIVAIAAMVYVNGSLRREVDRLAPLAEKYNEICGGVRRACDDDACLRTTLKQAMHSIP